MPSDDPESAQYAELELLYSAIFLVCTDDGICH